MQPEEQLIQQRIIKLKRLKELGINPYPYSFKGTTYSKEILGKNKKLEKDTKTNKNVKISGRIITLRDMGKVSFGHIQDFKGKIQFYIREDDNKNNYEILKNLDLGDIIGVEGTIFTTKAGEITIWTKKLILLAKALRPLPEKWHGLQDIEARYRYRHLDFISNPEVKETFVKRAEILRAIHEFMDSKGFIEIDTPILQSIYGGAHARPFKTFLHDLKSDMFLRISDELYLKRLMVGGFDKVYEIGRDFRNESITRLHNPEFTMMEAYWAYTDYNDMMELTEDLFNYIAKKVFGTTKFKINKNTIDIKKPWKRMTMKDALKKFANLDVDKKNDTELMHLLEQNDIDIKEFSRGIATAELFKFLVEPKLIQPIFIYDYPKETTPLCKVKRDNPELIERFEPFINGWELGNAYSELNDPIIQRDLLEKQAEELSKGKEEAHPMDEDFIRALEIGMPTMSGLGIGIDRMIMLFTGKESIRDVIAFPFMKPEK